MILEYTSVRLLLQSAASISCFFVCGKNGDGCDNNIALLYMIRDHVCTNRARFLVVQ